MNKNLPDSAKQSSQGLLVPSVVIGVAALIGYAIYKAPLESARPDLTGEAFPLPLTPPPLKAVRARLWQDPLSVVYGHVAKPPTDARDPALRPKTDEEHVRAIRTYFAEARKRMPELTCMPVLLPGGPYANQVERRIRIRYAVLSALGSRGFVLKYPEKMTYLPLQVDSVVGTIGERPARSTINVPIKLFGRAPQGRTGSGRHVLVLWIDESQLGDRPLFALSDIVQTLFGDDPGKLPIRIVGPCSTDGLFALLNPAKKKTEGPNPDVQSCFQNCQNVKVFSQFATTDDQYLDVNWRANLQELIKREGGPKAPKSLEVIRTVGPDSALFRAMLDELKLRGSWPDKHVVLVTEHDTRYGRDLPAAFLDAMHERSGRDVESLKEQLHVYKYLRGLDGKLPAREQASKNAARDDKKDNKDGEPRRHGRSQLDYLRRLELQLADLDYVLNRKGEQIGAVGVMATDTYDKLLVLRALRKRFPRVWFFTNDLEAQLADPIEFEYTHNLLVASHFGLSLNDRLLNSKSEVGMGRHIEFRECYQTATFFSVLLALEDELTNSVLGCPDDPWGYRQGECDERASALYLEPLVYEIGRTGPFRLTVLGKSGNDVSSRVHPEDNRGRDGFWKGLLDWRLWGALLTLALLCTMIAYGFPSTRRFFSWSAAPVGCVFLHAVAIPVGFLLLHVVIFPISLLVPRTRSDAGKDETFFQQSKRFCGNYWDQWQKHCVRWWSNWVLAGWLITIALLVAVAFDHARANGEPFSLSDNVSAWPAVLLRYVITLLAVGFVWRCFKVLRDNHKRNVGNFFLRRQPEPARDSSADEPTEYVEESIDKYVELIDEMDYERTAPIAEPPRWCGRWWQRFLTAVRFEWKSTASEELSSYNRFHALYLNYLRKGRFWLCGLRVGIVVTLYSLAALLLLWITDSLQWGPYRGDLARWLGSVITGMAVLAIIVLIFYVLDATHLCRKFVRALAQTCRASDDHVRREKPDPALRWPKQGVEALARQTTKIENGDRTTPQPYPPGLARDVLAVHLIAERSKSVQNLFYFPFTTFLLLILTYYPALDNWDLPLPQLILVVIGLVIAVVNAILLRTAAEDARLEVMQRLQREMAVWAGKGDVEERQYELAIQEIRQEHRGAFSSFAETPLIRAILIPFGGIGSVVLIEQLIKTT